MCRSADSLSPQVLVRVMSAGLDRADLLSVSGWGRVERGKPYGGFTLGRDFCGVVLEAGRGVEHLHPGDKVWGGTPYHAPGTVKNMGTWSSTAVYVSLILSCTSILIKWTLVVCIFCSVTYVAALFYPLFYTLIPTALILGLGAAPVWTAK